MTERTIDSWTQQALLPGIVEHLADSVALRHQIHAHPELAYRGNVDCLISSRIKRVVRAWLWRAWVIRLPVKDQIGTVDAKPAWP